MTSQFPSDIYWEGLSYLQLQVQRVSRQDLEGFVAFFRRHKSLKRIVLCLKGLRNNEEDDDDQQEEDEEGDKRLIKEIQAILPGIDHDVRIINSGDRKWVE
ncbi:hypothetical protein G7Y89_g1581 [Cudoniella acicularis]|uniref:Uncharacterized protein n=1 Tax=Cudoniella acicularis TaxID=354080 RepID=A0A8H4RV12_9HELO|nr:hypothetical protein G7Y89_g1581 [Cudoniella acicularis]